MSVKTLNLVYLTFFFPEIDVSIERIFYHNFNWCYFKLNGKAPTFGPFWSPTQRQYIADFLVLHTPVCTFKSLTRGYLSVLCSNLKLEGTEQLQSELRGSGTICLGKPGWLTHRTLSCTFLNMPLVILFFCIIGYIINNINKFILLEILFSHTV